jgi:putative DNA primase/helicase
MSSRDPQFKGDNPMDDEHLAEWKKTPDTVSGVSPPTEDERIVPSPQHPMGVARAFISDQHTLRDELTLRHHRGAFHVYDGRCWPEAEERRVRGAVWSWLENALYIDDQKVKPFNPTRYKVANVMEALAAIGHVDGHTQPPLWIDTGPAPASEIVSMANGLFHLSTRTLHPHSPRLFVPYSLPFVYDPEAPTPMRWHRFLEELWEDDQEAKDTLAEIMGYVLAGDTRQQKIFLLVGPLRSGKGTIGRVLRGLLGDHHVAAPTMAGLVTNFGLQPLIGKPLALISDARLSTRADSSVAVERLLSISGEDSLTIDRKYQEPWTGQLPSRFLILTNELPRLVDSSGALAGRFIVLTTTRSFFGEEDPTLTDQLLGEAPGIFNWALEGLDRLQARGHFRQPTSSTASIELMADLTSPIGAFVRQRCVVGPYRVPKDDLFAAWKDWCTEEGLVKPGTKNVFFRDLRAAVPTIKVRRLRAGDDRAHVIEGVGLRSGPDDGENNGESSLTTPDQHPERGPGQRSRSGIVDPQNRRSETLVMDGQGSPPLYVQREEASPTSGGPIPDQNGVVSEEQVQALITRAGSVAGAYKVGLAVRDDLVSLRDLSPEEWERAMGLAGEDG